MKNQYKGMSREMREFYAAHSAYRMQELIERNAPADFIDRVDQDQTDIFEAMNHAEYGNKK